MTSGSPEQPICPDCGARVCSVHVNGEWKLGDWPPVVPVVDLQRIVIATNGDYSKMEEGEIKRDNLAFDAWPVGGPVATILLQLHDCDAIVRYRGQMTSRGAERMREFERKERGG